MVQNNAYTLKEPPSKIIIAVLFHERGGGVLA